MFTFEKMYVFNMDSFASFKQNASNFDFELYVYDNLYNEMLNTNKG